MTHHNLSDKEIETKAREINANNNRIVSMNEQNHSDNINDNNNITSRAEKKEAEESVTREKKHTVSSEDMARAFESASISEELKKTVRILLLTEHNNIMTSVLERLDGHEELWLRVKKEPDFLLAMLTEEQQKSMNRLQREIGASMQKRKDVDSVKKKEDITNDD